MRRLAVVAALAASLALPGAAGAHPLGNFSLNHQARVAVSADRVDVTYLLDQAEIPTFQERGRPHAAVLARKRAEIVRGLALTVDGRVVALRPGAARIAFPAGQGGLATTRVELELSAPVAAAGRTVRLRDATFPGRVGWKAIVAVPGHGTAVRSSVPADDPTARLTRYPQDLLRDPADQREAAFAVRAGAGTVTAPRFDGTGTMTVRAASPVEAAARGGVAADGAAAGGVPDRGGDGFAGALDGGGGLSLLLLLAAFGWGAVHALSPGHGKAMVAAYLVGTRGTARHAVALGAAVTVTHTAGVFALGVVTLALSAAVVPEDLYPWLNLVAGLLVAGVGASVLRSRLRARRAHHHHHHHHHHHDRITWRGIVAMGASAGIVPCPSALVVLLAAIAQHQVALGLALIVAFSAGLATTLTALGLAVVASGRALGRLGGGGRVAAALPALSAFAIVGVGCVLTLRALSGIA
ncbi:MAG TPA: sulfite exporter TauE/SafE family protein [Solirubrobacteraceae bacterium]|nr:sulfite exporter TauE/SafE family protein [Solirubrobacteraceae bacterium]